MLKLTLLAAVFTPVIAAAEPNRFFEVGVGIMDENFLAKPEGVTLDDPLIPGVSLGIGYEYSLNEDWQLQSALSLNHARSGRFVMQNAFQPSTQNILNATVENTGLWLDTRLKYTSLFDNVSPFVSVGAGRVYGRYQDDISSVSGWENGVRAQAGLEFEVSPDFSFSFALGTGDVGELD